MHSVWNGMEGNGMQWNETKLNTMEYNAMQYNATQYNKMRCNAIGLELMELNAMECNGLQCKDIPNQENKDEEKLSNGAVQISQSKEIYPALSATSVSQGALYLTLFTSQSLQEMSLTLLTHFPH